MKSYQGIATSTAQQLINDQIVQASQEAVTWGGAVSIGIVATIMAAAVLGYLFSRP